MKKLLWLLAISLLLGSMASCTPGGEPTESESDTDMMTETSVVISDATGETPAESLLLQSGAYQLALSKYEKGWRVAVLDATRVLYANDQPAIVKTVQDVGRAAATAGGAYDTAVFADGKITCEATVTSRKGASFRVVDVYSATDKGFLMDRNVTVLAVGEGEKGFSTMYTMSDVDGGARKDYEFFIPSILHKDSETLGSNAIMATMTSINHVKETRCGTPLAMLRGAKDGYAIALVHVNPKISAEEKYFQQACVIDNSQQYGSIGFTINMNRAYAASVDFVYPSTETPKSYETGSAVSRYHEIKTETVQQYTLGILPTHNELYNGSMVDTYLNALSFETPEIADVDLDAVYEANMELYDELYLKYENTSTGNHSAGFPFAVNVVNLKDFYAVSFQMGFIGAQVAIAAELIRDGYLNQDANATKMGQEILDFWTSTYVYNKALPPSWWQPSTSPTAGGSTGYPSFLRCFVDGAEGMLNACIYAKEAGLDYSQWENALNKIGKFLKRYQNEDGSYYRAYNVDGSVCKDTSSPAYQGTSKLNTPVAVRFLCNMYEYTGDKGYYDAAVKAADYCYNELYLNLGKYVGGTPDNPNVPDKEAAIFALYAFSAIYDMTGDEKYYPALEHAAVSAMSWTYTYDFAVPFATSTQYDKLNIFKEGNTAGWTIIATGHSAIDIFGASAYHEIFKQYLRSGNDSYLKVAGLLQNNNKKAMDLDGKWGYYYKGLCLEACNVADQIFYTAENGVWLPWISAAFMEPMIKMEEDFGSYDLYELLEKNSREDLLAKLK